jgi:hypothetical protein
VAWSFRDHLVIVNLSDAPAQGLVEIRVGPMIDLLTGARFERSGERLYVALDAWGTHLLRLE